MYLQMLYRTVATYPADTLSSSPTSDNRVISLDLTRHVTTESQHRILQADYQYMSALNNFENYQYSTTVYMGSK